MRFFHGLNKAEVTPLSGSSLGWLSLTGLGLLSVFVDAIMVARVVVSYPNGLVACGSFSQLHHVGVKSVLTCCKESPRSSGGPPASWQGWAMEGKGDVKTQSVYRGSGYRTTLSAMVRGVKREAKHTHMIGVQCALCSSQLCSGLPRPYLSLIGGTRCKKLS